MVFYFTATGNSLYTAKQFSDAPVSIPQIMKQDDLHFTDDTIGVVCPIFSGELSETVRGFLRKATFETDYLYFILTYGNDQTDAPEWTDAFCRELGHRVDYIHTVKMVDNYLPVFDMNEQMAMDKNVPEQMAEAKKAITERRTGIPASTEDGRRLHQMVADMFKKFPIMINGSAITATDACIGCGVCAKVCPMGNIEIREGKSVRVRKTCQSCFACVQNCPQKALTMPHGDRNPNARYRHPDITLDEIIAANRI
jgi:ferredoxin